MFKNFLDRFLTWLTPLKREPPGLLGAVNSAKSNWKQAQYDFNFVSDKNLIDYTVHQIKADERQYMALIQQAKQQNVTAWQKETLYTPETIQASNSEANEPA